MTLVSNLGLALGLSADAFAVSVGRGAGSRRHRLLTAARTGLLFGGVEALMVLAGYLLASRFAGWVIGLDHWIALVLLVGVGGHMIHEGLAGDTLPDAAGPRRRGGIATVLAAVGTSIDGAAIGVTFAFIAVDIAAAVLTVGLVSTFMSTLGLLIGPRVGAVLGRRAEVLGGAVLAGIGIAIWTSHVMGG